MDKKKKPEPAKAGKKAANPDLESLSSARWESLMEKLDLAWSEDRISLRTFQVLLGTLDESVNTKDRNRNRSHNPEGGKMDKKKKPEAHKTGGKAANLDEESISSAKWETLMEKLDRAWTQDKISLRTFQVLLGALEESESKNMDVENA